MNAIRTSASLAALAAAVVLIASACGGSGDSGAAAPAPGGSGPALTVSVENVDGVGDVLVDSQGAALYAADQEAKGAVVCSHSCTTIWDPLTVTGMAAPTGEAGVAPKLGVAKRPDGDRQVTFSGRLLYRFVEDPGPRTVTGNSFADTFDGRAFTWHVATPAGVSMSSSNSTSGTPGY